jgi:hypothetical protein
VLGEEKGRVAGDGGIERRRLLELRHQLAQPARVHNRAGELVGAEFAPFFKHVDIVRRKRDPAWRNAGPVALSDQLRQAQRACQPCGARADDQHIRFEFLTLNGHGSILAATGASEIRRG